MKKINMRAYIYTPGPTPTPAPTPAPTAPVLHLPSFEMTRARLLGKTITLQVDGGPISYHFSISIVLRQWIPGIF